VSNGLGWHRHGTSTARSTAARHGKNLARHGMTRYKLARGTAKSVVASASKSIGKALAKAVYLCWAAKNEQEARRLNVHVKVDIKLGNHL
jgi:hypothetical protein